MVEETVRYNIEPRNIEFDGFPVARLLPRRGLNGVGPWLFFDHMGPHDFEVGKGLDVPPHPHINLATVTCLFEKRTNSKGHGRLETGTLRRRV